LATALLAMLGFFIADVQAYYRTGGAYNPYTGASAQASHTSNPYTGQGQTSHSTYNPYTGKSSTGSTSYNPYTNTYSHEGQVSNPYTGRTVNTVGAYHP
jgi:hypothetical protein